MTALPDFDPSALEAHLAGKLGPGRLTEIQPVAGGQSNPTFFVTFGERNMVLRKKPAGTILPGAHAVEREYRMLSALRKTDVPTPTPILLCEEPDVIGTPFYLMERLHGRIFSDAMLPGLDPAERRAIYVAMATTLAKLHAVRPQDIGLGDFGKPGNYFERQFARWHGQWLESPTGDIPALDALADWLSSNPPPDDGQIAIAHGDYRLGNLIFHRDRPDVIGILDWELSTLGHPLADLGFSVMPWHTSEVEYGGLIDRAWRKVGIPREAEFLKAYYGSAGPTIGLQPFHIAFALFRFAVIFVGIADRSRAGTSAGSNADMLGPLAARFARRGLDVARPAIG